ncbi:hypothetical protein RhiirA4_480609 [Rhizophagus irregularis]|uniref:Uncharacterized protein n=1 Tax=Rhizophagus irregularis TaxID=588596 RepID=A0A2I1HIC0_9GLOM|nr:hypothetical protein RhiirA4_480609 [Rhizophagus irregularis]
METDFGLETGGEYFQRGKRIFYVRTFINVHFYFFVNFGPELKWGLILARNSEIETGDFGPELKWGPILAQNSEIETGGLIKC